MKKGEKINFIKKSFWVIWLNPWNDTGQLDTKFIQFRFKNYILTTNFIHWFLWNNCSDRSRIQYLWKHLKDKSSKNLSDKYGRFFIDRSWIFLRFNVPRIQIMSRPRKIYFSLACNFIAHPSLMYRTAISYRKGFSAT